MRLQKRAGNRSHSRSAVSGTVGQIWLLAVCVPAIGGRRSGSKSETPGGVARPVRVDTNPERPFYDVKRASEDGGVFYTLSVLGPFKAVLYGGEDCRFFRALAPAHMGMPMLSPQLPTMWLPAHTDSPTRAHHAHKVTHIRQPEIQP